LNRAKNLAGQAPGTILWIGDHGFFLIIVPANNVNEAGVETHLAAGTLVQVNLNFYAVHGYLLLIL